jgi:hypothetical protein
MENNTEVIKKNSESKNLNIDKKKNISCKQDLLMKSLSDFFFKKNNMEEMLPIINSESKISLRIIDWFVTNFSKKNNIVYNLNYQNKKTGEFYNKRFVVYLNYKSQLKAYSKKQFDPFCRRDRIAFYYEKDKDITTTVGQLNFFRWAIEHQVLKYIKENIKMIEDDMNLSVRNIYSKKNNKKSELNDLKFNNNSDNTEQDNIVEAKKYNIQLANSKTRKKRHELSLSATRSINKHNVKIVVKFE